MLSIIISSYQASFFYTLEANIAATCGLTYEIIKIDNPGLMSICEAYNRGAEKARYDNLLFLHEDVIFVDDLWGQKLIEILQKPNCGIVGVAGGDYYSYVPGSWWNNHHKFLHLIQADKSGNEHFNNRAGFPNNQSEINVKSLDGVFLACTKQVYNDVKFDERIDGYHGYDLIFSLKASKKYNNFVTDKILIKHFSSGTLSKEWLQNVIKVRDIIGMIHDQKLDLNIEMEKFYTLIIYLKKFGISRKESFSIILKYLNPKIFGLKNTIKIINRTKYLF